MARTPHNPTEAQRNVVKHMSIAGVPQTSIARCLGIGETSLRKYYYKELDAALDEAIGFATGQLMQKIRKGNLSAIIFFLKTRGRGEFRENFDMTGSIQLPDLDFNVLKKSND